MKIYNIDLNKSINDNLDANIYKKIYNINLKKGNTYFIALHSYNNNDLNLRLFNKNKDNIKLKYDKDEKKKFIDFECHESHKEIINKSKTNNSKTNNLLEINNKDFITDNELSDLISDILSKYIKELDNEIELVIEFDDSSNEGSGTNEDTGLNESDITKIKNKIKNKPLNFNNKVCFKASYTGEYYLMVSSDYNKIETKYFLSINQIENINNVYLKQIKLNEGITYKSKYKFNTKSYKIKLKKNVKYEIKSESKVIYLLYNSRQKLISKNNEFSFDCSFNGLFTIEIMSLEDDNTINFIISEL